MKGVNPMTQADSVHSTPRRTASLRKTSPAVRSPPPPAIPSIDPNELPDEYCLKLDGDCLEPLIPDGSAVQFAKSEKFGVGDIVCIWFRPEFSPPGRHQAWLKQIRLNVPPWVKQFPYNDHPESDVKALMVVEQLNPRRQYHVPCDQILTIHKAVGYSPARVKIGGTVNSATMLPIGKAVLS
jgi:hypothetical protein